MNDITFKIAKQGEGKTKWLLKIANQYAGTNRKVYLFTDDDQAYIKFCEKYFNTFSQVCPVERLTAFKLTENDVVLVDNLFKQCASIGDLNFIHKNCYKMFVTIEGTTTIAENIKTWDDIYHQVTIEEVSNA